MLDMNFYFYYQFIEIENQMFKGESSYDQENINILQSRNILKNKISCQNVQENRPETKWYQQYKNILANQKSQLASRQPLSSIPINTNIQQSTKNQQINKFIEKLLEQINSLYCSIRTQKNFYENQLKNQEISKISENQHYIKQYYQEVITSLELQLGRSAQEYLKDIDQLNLQNKQKLDIIREMKESNRKLKEQNCVLSGKLEGCQQLLENTIKQEKGLQKLVDEYQKELAKLNEYITTIKNQLETSNTKNAQYTQKIQQLQIQNSQLQEKQKQTNQQQIHKKQQQINELKSIIEKINSNLQVQSKINISKQQLQNHNSKLLEENSKLKNQLHQFQENQQCQIQTIQQIREQTQIKNIQLQEKYKNIITTQKCKSLQSVAKSKKAHETKYRLLCKFYMKNCQQQRKQIDKLKKDIEKQMLVFNKLFKRDVKNMLQGCFTGRF